MALNNEFKVKNDLNTLGRILSGGVDIRTIFSPSNTSWTLSANNGTFALSGGDTLQVQGGNGVDVRVATGTDTVRISGIDATTSVKGVASFSSDNFAVTNGVVTVKDGGIVNDELAGSITDTKLLQLTATNKVANSATTATSSNTNNAIVTRGASGEFSSGNITSSGTVEAVTVNATTGFRLNNGATTGNVLRGNGTNFVSSTLAASDIASGRSLTKADDTNVTLTLSGTPSTALLQNVGLTLGWTGLLAGSRGGTNNGFTEFTGPASTLKTFTLPNASATILTTNAAVTVLQGGTGATTAQGAINTLAGAVTSGQYLRGNGTNVVLTGIQVSDVPTLNQSTTGSAATLTTSRTLWGQSFNGSANVSGTLSAVGNIIGSGAITLSAGSGNNNINLTPSGTGLVTATGNLSASGTVAANTLSASNNLFVGDVQVRTRPTNNVFIGDGTTGSVVASGSNNFVFGNSGSGMFLTSGNNNVFLGDSVGRDNTTGSGNNFLGRNAGNRNTTGNANNFIGDLAGLSNTTGNANNIFGNSAGQNNTTGSDNNFLGTAAGLGNTTGNFNIFLGRYTGLSNQSGSNNTIIGNGANVATDSLSGVIVLGTGAVATESHQIVLSTANVSFRNIGSTFEIGTPSLTDNLTVFGAVSSTGIVNTNTGFRVNNGATTGNFLRGNGTNFVSSAILSGDVPTLNQSTTGSAATLTTSRTIAISGDLSYTSPPFNGSTNVAAAGTLATVNSNVGSFTNASVTVNAKGLVTAASSGTAPVTTVTGTSPVVSSGGTTPVISLAAGYGDTLNPYASKTQNTFLAAPSAGNGVPTFRTIGTADVPTLNQNTTGSAATLTTTRTLWGKDFNGSQNVTGNLTNVGDISGTGAINIYTGSAGNNISLIATGTGDIQLTPGSSGGTVNIPNIDLDGGTINGTTIGLTVPASGVFTGVNVTGNVTIGGNLFVAGSATQFNTQDLVVQDPIIFLAEGNLNDSVDIGFTAAYNHGLTPPRHTGLVRDNVTKEWSLFKNLSAEILSAIDIPFDDPSFQIDTLNANIKGTLTGNVSGTALRANQFTTARIISATGDISYSSGSFDGSANVTGTATINNNAVTYAKFQQVAAKSVVGNPTGSTANAQAIPASVTGFALLSAANAAAAATTIGLGTTNSVTFGEVIVNNGTRSVVNDVYNSTGTNAITLSTFANASYNSAKFTVQIKRVDTGARCALEIIATKNVSTWEGTVYGIVDPANLFTDVNITASSTVELAFTLVGATNHTITAYAQAISD